MRDRLTGSLDRLRALRRRWFAPPVLSDDERKTGRAALLGVILVAAGELTWRAFQAFRRAGAHTDREMAERQRVEKELQMSQARWRLLADHSAEIICTLDLATRKFSYVSPSVLQLRGLTPDQVLAQPVQAVMTPESYQSMAGEMRRRLAALAHGDESARVGTHQIDQYRKDGSIVPTEVVTALLTDTNGQVTQVLSLSRDITETTRLAHELQSERDFAMTVINTMGQGLSVTDDKRHIEYVNAAFAHMLGYAPAELVGTLAKDLYCPADFPILERARAERLAGRTSTYEIRMVHKDGRRVDVQITATPRWQGNRIKGTVAVATDLTERKRAEASLRASEERYRTLFDNLPIPVFTKDLDGRYTSCNAEDLKYWRTNPVGYTDADFVSAATAQAWREQDRQVIQRQTPLDLEEQLHTADGLHVMQTRLVPLRDAAGNVIGILGAGVDVTERNRMEEQLRQRSRAIEASPVSIVVTDLAGDIEYVNPRFTLVTGYTPDEVRGKNPRILQSDRTPRTVYSELWATILDGKEWHGEFQNKKKSGELYYEWASISPILDGDGKITHFVAVKEEITVRKHMEEQLRASEELYHQMFHRHSAVKLVTDPETGTIVDANLAAAEFYGYPLDDLRTMNMDQIRVLPPDQAAHAPQAVLNRDPNYTIVSHRLASGELRDVEVYSVPLQTQDRTVLYSIIHDITARRQAEMRLRYLSTHDSLTGLYNRAFFESELTRYGPSREYPISLLIADADNLKLTNDTRGHAAGDELLQCIARALQAACRTSDIVARIGGDEFAILLPATDAAAAAQFVARVHQKLGEQSRSHPDLTLQLAMGIATASGGDLDAAFRLADERMYADKRTHKQRT